MLEENQKPTIGVLLHSFFVIPFIIAVVAVLLFTGMKLLTAERKTVYDYVTDIKIGGKSKRWQAAFELSKLLKNPKNIPTNARFVQEMKDVFRESIHDDVRVRDYMAMAMGRTGQLVYEDDLLTALQSKEESSLIAIVTALGLLKSDRAIPYFERLFQSKGAPLRLAIVMALGDIGSLQAIPTLQKALKDEEHNVCWDAAVVLAQLKNAEGKPILKNLLDRRYWAGYANVNREEQNRAIMVAIQSAMLLNDSDLNLLIKDLAQNDTNIEVRKVALRVLK